MITSFFETNVHCEWAASFQSEELYMLCLPILEKHAKDNGMILTETT